MIRIALILMLVLASQAQGTIALVTGNIGYNSGASNVTTSGAITISPSMTTGQYLVVAISSANVALITATNLELIGEVSYFGASTTTQLFALFRATGTVSSYTINTTSGTVCGLSAMAAVFSATNRLRIDTSAFATATSASVASGTPATTASANELWIGLASLRGIINATWSTAKIDSVAADNTYFTSTNIGTAASERSCALWYRIVAATSSTAQATITASSSGVYAAGSVCLEETPAAAAGEVSYGFSQ